MAEFEPLAKDQVFTCEICKGLGQVVTLEDEFQALLHFKLYHPDTYEEIVKEVR